MIWVLGMTGIIQGVGLLADAALTIPAALTLFTFVPLCVAGKLYRNRQGQGVNSKRE